MTRPVVVPTIKAPTTRLSGCLTLLSCSSSSSEWVYLPHTFFVALPPGRNLCGNATSDSRDSMNHCSSFKPFLVGVFKGVWPVATPALCLWPLPIHCGEPSESTSNHCWLICPVFPLRYPLPADADANSSQVYGSVFAFHAAQPYPLWDSMPLRHRHHNLADPHPALYRACRRYHYRYMPCRRR